MRLFCWLTLWFAIGLLTNRMDRSRVRADPPVPNACPAYECKSIHGVWEGPKDAVFANWVAKTNGAQLALSAYGGTGFHLFTDGSIEKNPIGDHATDKIDVYLHVACVPTCGKDAKGVWQAPQQVSIVGPGQIAVFFGTELRDIPRRTCTVGAAPPLINPANLNTDKNNPPGYK